ncbi:hypothetical protein [Rhodococcus marinonascens]|uniref:hypothetical protein n=1 Tax=Rhodococcus marinonascens TaxID=38311 RepID=UPI0009337BBA|nr:hypothetical protein [Rhodococcus marinonascens]
MKVAVLTVDGVFDSGLSVVLDVLATANVLYEGADVGQSPFTVAPVAMGRSVRTGHGLVLATTPLEDIAESPDVLLMPAIGVRTPAQVLVISRLIS